MCRQQIIVDRIEGDIAVCEVGNSIKEIALSKITGEVREGDVLCVNGDGASFSVNMETDKRREHIANRFAAIRVREKRERQEEVK